MIEKSYLEKAQLKYKALIIESRELWKQGYDLKAYTVDEQILLLEEIFGKENL